MQGGEGGGVGGGGGAALSQTVGVKEKKTSGMSERAMNVRDGRTDSHDWTRRAYGQADVSNTRLMSQLGLHTVNRGGSSTPLLPPPWTSQMTEVQHRSVAGLHPVARAEEAPGNFSNCKCSVFTAKDVDKIGEVGDGDAVVAAVETEKPNAEDAITCARRGWRGQQISADPVQVRAKTTVSMNESVTRQQDSARMVLMSSTESEKLQPSEKNLHVWLRHHVFRLRHLPSADHRKQLWNRVPVAWKQNWHQSWSPP